MLITGVPTLETAIAAANEGANRYVIKDHDLVEQLRVAVREVSENLKWKKEAGYLRRELRRLTGLDNIIGQSPKMKRHFRPDPDRGAAEQPRADHRRKRHGQGIGGARHPRKQRAVARALHHHQLRSVSRRRCWNRNCSATSKGAFTGANENRRGLFQAAHGGTLFMDEIGNMNLAMQVKLYRVLQEGKVRPLGSTEEIDVDVRVIAATNKDLEKAIAAGDSGKICSTA